ELTVEASHETLQPNCCAAFSVEVESEERLVIVQEVREEYLDTLDADKVFTAIRQAISQQHQLHVYAVLLLNRGSTPKTNSGKIQRHACKAGFIDGSLSTFASSIEEFNPLQKQVFFDKKALLNTSLEKQTELLKSHLENLISHIFKKDKFELDSKQSLIAIGLDSIKAVELINLLENSLGCSFDSTLISDYPIVENLIDYLNRKLLSQESSQGYKLTLLGEKNLGSSVLVPIQSKGSKPPLFFIPGVLGTILFLNNLASHLGQDQPFYGLQALGSGEGAEPLTKVEEMAECYIEAIQSVQPQGPYFLAGYSFGGQVAFEMCQQLQSQGYEVAFLAILDTPAPLFNPLIYADWSDAQFFNDIINFSELLLGKQIKVDYKNLSLLSLDEQLDYVTELLVNIIYSQPFQAARKQLRGFIKVSKASFYAMSNYSPKEIYSTPITIFRSSELFPWIKNILTEKKIAKHPKLGWEKFSTEPVEAYSVPGNHTTMMYEPHVQTLASFMKESLQKAQVSCVFE
ncbi:MAG: thioesterase domain-containing protein, partial [Rivularia sp. ALOHA_DT_140]|nr:thioesterase domain-containing protein [Rivularia sp. ALOHA_DT_140]